MATAPLEVDKVATLDFLATAARASRIQKAPVKEDLGVLREVMTENFLKAPPQWSGEIDGRGKTRFRNRSGGMR